MKIVFLLLLLVPLGLPRQSTDRSPEATSGTVEGANQPGAEEPCASDP